MVKSGSPISAMGTIYQCMIHLHEMDAYQTKKPIAVCYKGWKSKREDVEREVMIAKRAAPLF